MAGCGYVPGLGPAVDIPTGVPHEMSVADVEQAVRTAVADDARALGRLIRPFRVTSIRLIAPFQPVSAASPDGQPGVDELQHEDHDVGRRGGRDLP